MLQFVQADNPVVLEKVPGKQFIQLPECREPVPVEYVPDEHGKHALNPVFMLKVPGKHAEHARDEFIPLLLLNVPALQFLHDNEAKVLE